jgi:PIN domain nuclease of toxin-antitoxin system
VIVLDTHAWLWWVSDPPKLGEAAREALDRADEVGICTISCWEVAMLSLRGRIQLDREIEAWVGQALAHPRATALPLTAPVATRAALLEDEGFPGDPADRIIYATARAEGSRLLTRDAGIQEFDPRLAIW